jgi:hypothetical protein
MGRAGRAEMARTHSPAVHLARLEDVYHEAGASLEVTA